MKYTFLMAAAAACLIASSASAATVKYEYNDVKGRDSSARADLFKLEVSDEIGKIDTTVEVNFKETTTNIVDDQLIAKAGTSFNYKNIRFAPRVEFGRTFRPGNDGNFVGIEGKLSSPTPIQNLTATVGVRRRQTLNNMTGQNTLRLEGSTEYALTSKYSIGAAYYRTSGDVHSDIFGGYLKVRF